MKYRFNLSRFFLPVVTFSAVLAVASFVPADSYAAPKSAKKLKTAFKEHGLAVVPPVSKAVGKSKSAKKATRGVGALASQSAPTLFSLAQESTDPALLDSIVWDGALAKIAAGTASEAECESFHQKMGTCQMLQSTLQGFSTAQQGDTTACYLSSITKVSSGASWDGPGSAKDSLDPGAADKFVAINISGFEGTEEGGGGEGEGGGGGPERIVAHVGKQTGNVLYSVDLAMCDPETNELRGANRIRVTKDGKILSQETNNEEGDKRSFKLVGFLNLEKGTGEFDHSKAKTIIIESNRAEGSFSGKIKIDASAITQSIVDNFGSFQRKLASKSSYSGSSLATLKFLEGGANGQESYNGETRTFSGGVEWSASEGRYVDASNKYEKSAKAVELSGEFFEAAPDGEQEIADLKAACDRTEFTGTLTLDFSDPALRAVAEECEPQIRHAEICFNNSLFQEAQNNYHTACSSGGPGEGGGGPGEGGGEQGPG